MTKPHTQGQWKANKKGDVYVLLGDGWSRNHIAQVYKPEDVPLVTVAPELLEACERLLRQIVETSAYDDAKKGEDPGLLADVEFARAVHAKARGEA